MTCRAGVCALVLLTGLCSAQVRAYREAHEHAIVDEFVTLLSVPNLASDPASVQRNADLLRTALLKRNVNSRLLTLPGVPPAVFGEIRTPGATRTLLFYAHYDGQPLKAEEWASDPFRPVLRDRSLEHDGKTIPMPSAAQSFDPESRIYARSASDDKGAIIAMLAALDALQASRTPLRSNLKFLFEGEEEAGSPHLGEILKANQELLRADAWMICDGPAHQSRRQQVVFGARGIETVDITLYGPRRELHSGHYGNWAPNPAMMLARLLASMKDDDGRVLVPHFYDGIDPLSQIEKQAIASAPVWDKQLKEELWLGRTENPDKTLLELYNLPSLNIRGMASSRIGKQASNVVPSTAMATIDMRLVNGIDHREASKRLIEHIRNQGYFITDAEPSGAMLMSHPRVAKIILEPGGYNAIRTPMDLPISRQVIAAVTQAHPGTIVVPTLGGSVPLFMIDDVFHVPTILIPIANHDNNQHSFNENLRLQNLWDGIETMAALFTMR